MLVARYGRDIFRQRGAELGCTVSVSEVLADSILAELLDWLNILPEATFPDRVEEYFVLLAEEGAHILDRVRPHHG